MPQSRSLVPSRGLLAALLPLALLWPRPVGAFGVTDVFLRNADGSSVDDVYNSLSYLNQERCCRNDQLQVEIRFETTTPASDAQHIVVVAGPGSSCLDVAGGVALTGPGTLKAASTCPVLYSDRLAKGLPSGPLTFSVSSQQLTGSVCNNQLFAPWNIFVYLNDTNVDSRWSEAKKLQYTVATQPPEKPTTHGASDLEAGEGSVQVKVTIPGAATSTDAGSSTLPVGLKGYQVLCEKIDDAGQPAGAALASPPTAAFKPPPTGCLTTKVTDAGVVREAGVDGRSEARVPDARAPDAKAPDAAASKDLGTTDTSAVLDAGTARDRGPVDQRFTEASTSSTAGCASNLTAACVCAEHVSSSTSVRVKGLQNGQKYRFYLVAVDNYFNPSQVVTVGDETPVPVEDLWKRYQRAGGRASGGYCFVATAAYGSYDHPQVRILRDFRDQVLLPSSLGQIMVGSYYRGGAAPAAWLERHDGFKPLVRAALWPVALVAAGIVYTSPTQKLLGLTLLPAMGLLLLRRRRERAGHGKRGRA